MSFEKLENFPQLKSWLEAQPRLAPCPTLPNRPDLGQAKQEAAVLIWLDPRQKALLFLQRRDDLNHHAGQWCFPGGRKEAADNHPRDTALREAKEEVGVEFSPQHLAMELPANSLPSGFRVKSYLYFAEQQQPLSLQPSEIQASHWLPLEQLQQPDFVQIVPRKHQDQPWLDVRFDLQARDPSQAVEPVWGFTGFQSLLLWSLLEQIQRDL